MDLIVLLGALEGVMLRKVREGDGERLREGDGERVRESDGERVREGDGECI